MFEPGQTIECVDNIWASELVVGRHYTIESIVGVRDGIQVLSIEGLMMTYSSTRFKAETHA